MGGTGWVVCWGDIRDGKQVVNIIHRGECGDDNYESMSPPRSLLLLPPQLLLTGGGGDFA